MPSAVVSATLQSTVLCITSNLLAQTLKSYSQNKPYSIDFTPLFQFIIFTLLNTPPNFLWQQYLEETFPGHTIKPAIVPVTDASASSSQEKPKQEIVPRKQLNVRNTAIKFGLDQTVGALFNTVVFLAGMAALRGVGTGDIVALVKKDTIPLLLAGYKLWPAVSLLCFTVIPFQYRIVFGGIVGIGWGVFLSMYASG